MAAVIIQIDNITPGQANNRCVDVTGCTNHVSVLIYCIFLYDFNPNLSQSTWIFRGILLGNTIVSYNC